MPEPTYCIIGATGFIGRHFMRHLAANSIQRIRCLSRQARDSTTGVQWVIGHLQDEPSLRELIVDGAIVINLGAVDPVAGPSAYALAARLLSHVCMQSGAQRLIHVSTTAIAGASPESIITEDTPCAPKTEYERAKFEMESVLLAETQSKLPVLVLRPTAVFGVGGRNLVSIARRVASSGTLALMMHEFVHGARRMNLTPVENVVGAIDFLANMPIKNMQEVFIVSDDDAANNNYAFVASRLTAAFTKKAQQPIAIHLPARWLSLLLRMRGRSNTNPFRHYSGDKLLRRGFNRAIEFEDALQAYTRYLAVQWTRDRRISG